MSDTENQVIDETSKVEAVEEEEELNLTNLKKKKKKKKVELDLDEPQGEDGGDDELDLSKKKKKKKGSKKADLNEDDALADKGEMKDQWEDRDYTYDELLDRAFNQMKSLNPDMVAGEKKRFIMKPPQCARVGTKKTSFVNFTEICQMLGRQPKHILTFILAELGASGSVDGNNQLIIKGRFQQKQLESVLRKYIREYVTCHTCKSPETLLERDVRLYFLRCTKCKSSCSVAAIKSGFQAQIGKRARLRAKANS